MTRTVLVVDDEPDIRELVRAALEHLAGWRVLVASGGQEALALAAAEQPEAILLDVMMPGMDGPEAARRLGEDPRTRTIPVVMLTAKAMSVPDVTADPGPVVGVLAKPFDVLTLAGEVEQILGWAS
ncbi:response regulator [Cellulomonas aerilata]|uniref:Response regulator n=1 Tax=Cellulomonas aerilata TaxID=515326 RepID=A0A512DB05_9CELL|nr:response regulator [Cellulomonas aerilata]GEO33666.1 response regulator [Cellulomonas aerilata]